VFEVDARNRYAIHLAAVFACNFTNHLIHISEHILNDQGFDLQLLRPLIAETLNKSLDLGPADAQTGPAARGDSDVINRHMVYLENTGYDDIYRLITQQIIDFRHVE
jgi:predicted short-subunit dehydrogenase-like oxidoreductase (DUF2520 family)